MKKITSILFVLFASMCFSVAVSARALEPSPNTGDNILLPVAIAVIAAVAIVVVLLMKNKNK